MKRVYRLIVWFFLVFQCTTLALTDQAYGERASGTKNVPFFSYLTDAKRPPVLIDYSPSDFDPRHGENFHLPSPLSIEKDLLALRSVFDGLVVYSYHPRVTPIILEKAKSLGFRAVILGIWGARSTREIQGVITLVHQYADEMALAICLGNEGLYFHRYTMDDLVLAKNFLQMQLGPDLSVPITTSEPMSQYRDVALYRFGDFLAPNIHPVWEKPALPPKDAVFWTRNQAIGLMEKAHKPVLVKETGFPQAGERHFTPQSQKKFWDMYLKEKRLVYSQVDSQVWVSFATSFEAFSLPWKAEQSGQPVESAWGLMNKERVPYPAFYTWSNLQSSFHMSREDFTQRVETKRE
ncbi:MAG: hypothetical protein MRJ96_15230 [Nitrospirales bacterium]|nr:hypothetical protein [Nitrospira sp.]MDR4502795.1 hypothetical protein [Nitrospirales bacterium]